MRIILSFPENNKHTSLIVRGFIKINIHFISVYLGITETRVDFNIPCTLRKTKTKWYQNRNTLVANNPAENQDRKTCFGYVFFMSSFKVSNKNSIFKLPPSQKWFWCGLYFIIKLQMNDNRNSELNNLNDYEMFGFLGEKPCLWLRLTGGR